MSSASGEREEKDEEKVEEKRELEGTWNEGGVERGQGSRGRVTEQHPGWRIG